MKRKSSVAFIVLGSTSALCFQTDALINNNAHPLRRQSTSSLLHQQSDSEYDYDIYYHENDVQPQPYFNVPDDSTSFYRMQDDQFETASIADVDSDQYGQDPIRNTAIGKTKTKPNKIMGMFSQVFPNQPKNEPPSNPTSLRVSLPDLHQLISEEDLQKVTSRAISGGKIVSSLIRDVLLNTAKLAIGALESNKTAESMQSTSYTDVCEFDDELCREIEDALAATESFKSLSEQSRERSSTLNIQVATDFMNGEVSKSNTYESAYELARQSSSDAYSRIQDSNSAKQVSDYYFATTDQNSSTEDYYKRALEQQLIGIDQAKSNVRMRQEVSPSVPVFKSTVKPPTLARSKLLDDNVFEQRQRDKAAATAAAATKSTGRIDEQRTNPGRNTDTHDFERQSTLRRDNSLTNRPARSGVSNVSVGASRPHNSRYESRKIVHDEAPDSIKLHITDEALAFSRSLNLDVYEIYLSTRTPGSIMSGKSDGPMGEDVLTLDDAIWYCDRMQIGPMHRSAERRHQLNNDGRRPVRDQSRQAPKIRQSTKDHQLDAKNKMIDRGQVRRRSSGDVDMQHRERHTATREPRFIPRDYKKQSRLDSRVARFRQYPREKNVTQRPPMRTVSNSDPRNTIRRHDHYPSSMSRLIAAEPTISSQSTRPSRKSTMSTVSLAKLIQGPKEIDAAQVPTNRFREPYQEGIPTVQRQPRDNISGLQREVNSNSISPRVRSTQLSLRELSERAPPVSTSEKSTAYHTEGALEMAQKHGINLENVSSGSDDPITSDDVKHYIESRKSMRASRLNGFPSQRESQYIDQFASYFNSETASKLQQHQQFTDTSGTT